MRFSIFGFLIGRAIAQNRGVPSGTAATDGFVAGVVRPPVLGIVLVSALARNQVASLPAPAPAPAPTLTAVTVSGNTMTLTGTNFGTDLAAIVVSFSWTGTEISVAAPQVTAVTPTSITLIIPVGILQSTTVGIAVNVGGNISSTLSVQPAGTAANIAATSGTPQSTVVRTEFGNALVATVTDSWGNPLRNVTVTFTVPAAGASATLTNNTNATNASGQATTDVVTANATAGSYTVTATAPGVRTPANFVLTNTSS